MTPEEQIAEILSITASLRSGVTTEKVNAA